MRVNLAIHLRIAHSISNLDSIDRRDGAVTAGQAWPGKKVFLGTLLIREIDTIGYRVIGVHWFLD